MKKAGYSEDLNQEIYGSAIAAGCRRFTSGILNFKLKDSFDNFVHNALSAITDIIPTNVKDALALDALAIIFSDFPQDDDLLHIPNYCNKSGLPVTTRIRLLEIHAHISHPETILDPLELTDKEAGSIRERPGLLLLHICGATEEDLHQYVSGWRRKSAESMKEFRAM